MLADVREDSLLSGVCDLPRYVRAGGSRGIEKRDKGSAKWGSKIATTRDYPACRVLQTTLGQSGSALKLSIMGVLVLTGMLLGSIRVSP